MGENVTIKGGLRVLSDERLRDCETVLERQRALATTLTLVRDEDGDVIRLLVRDDTSAERLKHSDGSETPVREVLLREVVGLRLKDVPFDGVRLTNTISLEGGPEMVTIEEAAEELGMSRDALYNRIYRAECREKGSTPFLRVGKVGRSQWVALLPKFKEWAEREFTGYRRIRKPRRVKSDTGDEE